MQTEDQAVEWLERVAMRPMLESLLESVCKDKPDNLHNYAIAWMRGTYADLAEEAGCHDQPDGAWATRDDVSATPEGLMAYLKEIEATSLLEAIIERAIRAQPPNVVAYVIEEFDALREAPAAVPAAGVTQGAATAVVARSASFAISVHPKARELIDAIESGEVEMVEELLAEGVPADSKDDDGMKTALMYAAEGERGCLDILLAHGATVDFQSKHGETALMAAIKYGDVETVQVLLDAGADARNVRDISGHTAVDCARDDEAILRLLDPAAADALADALAKARAARPTSGQPTRGPRRNSVSSESIDPKKSVLDTNLPVYEKSAEELRAIEVCIGPHLLFRDLDADTKQKLMLSMTERRVAVGEAVIKQGQDGDFFYIVDTGKLDCSVRDADLPEPGRKVKEYTPGTTFGELALMYNTPRAATVVATEACKLWCIEREVFRSLILSTYMRKRASVEQVLSTVPLLQSMHDTERGTLADAFDEHSFAAGSAIITEGDEGNAFYIVVDGEAVATQRGADGTAHEVMHYSANSHFGELALMKQIRRQATVRAVTDCKCILLDKFSFERLLGPIKSILERDADAYVRYDLPPAQRQ